MRFSGFIVTLRETNSRNGFILSVAAALPLIVTLNGPAFEIRDLLLSRWFTFIYFSLLILASYGFVTIL